MHSPPKHKPVPIVMLNIVAAECAAGDSNASVTWSSILATAPIMVLLSRCSLMPQGSAETILRSSMGSFSHMARTKLVKVAVLVVHKPSYYI